MKSHEIFWIIGIAVAFIGAMGADSESLIPIWMILAGCAVIATGLIIKGRKAPFDAHR